MKTTFAIAAILGTLSLASLPAHAQSSGVTGRGASRAAAISTIADVKQDQQAANRDGGKKCWYVLDVLLCE